MLSNLTVPHCTSPTPDIFGFLFQVQPTIWRFVTNSARFSSTKFRWWVSMRRTKRGGFFLLSTRLTKPNPMSSYLQVRADRVNEETIPSPSSSYSSLFFRSLPSPCFPFIFFFASLCFSPPLLFFFPSPMLFFFPPRCSSSPLLLIFFPPLDFLLPLFFFPFSLSLLNPNLLQGVES